MLTTLEEAGGGKCDACKTFVELLTEEFKQLGLKHAKQVGTGEFGQAEKSMHVDQDMEATLVRSLCQGSRYKPFAAHIRKGCTDLMGSGEGGEILRTFQAGKLRPNDTVHRKQSICTDIAQVCPSVKVPKKINRCRACSEAMQDLHFVLRRAAHSPWSPELEPARGSKSAQLHRYSRKHVMSELQELCYDSEQRHPTAVAAEVQEVCELITEDYLEEVVSAFSVMKSGPAAGHYNPNPARVVCVDSTKFCKPRQFDSIYESLTHFHHNFTSRQMKAVKAAEAAAAQQEDSIGASQPVKETIIEEAATVFSHGEL